MMATSPAVSDMSIPGKNGGDPAARAAGLVRSEIRALSAYHVPDPGNCIKLDAMENPYDWPQPMVEQWLEVLRGVAPNRYPDPGAGELKTCLRKAMDIPADVALMLGNGSDELIQLIAQAVAAPGRVMLTPEPGFVMYRLIATVTGLRYAGVPLNDDFSLDADAMLAAIAEHQPAVVFLACPNNPTGNLFDADVVQQIIASSPGLVVLDEAYAPFTDSSYLSALNHYDNLLVMRTVSKMGLAGLRLGWLAGAPAWIDEFDKLRLPYNINVLTQASVTFALSHADLLREQARAIRRDRAVLFDALASRDGVTAYPSEANFILFRVADADAVHAHLRDVSGVLIKNLHGSSPLLEQCLRVTVGRPEENAAFLAGLDQALRG